MAVLADLRSLFRRRPRAVDMESTQAAGLADAMLGATAVATGPERPVRAIEVKPSRPLPTEQLVEAAGRIESTLERSVDRLDEVLAAVRNAPSAATPLQELNRNHLLLLERLSDLGDAVAARDDRTADALASLARHETRQAELLDGMRKQCESAESRTAQVGHAIDELRSTLDMLAGAQARTAQAITEHNRATRQHEQVLMLELGRTRLWTVATIGIVGVLLAVTMAVLTLAA